MMMITIMRMVMMMREMDGAVTPGSADFKERLIRILQLVFSPTAYTAIIITCDQSFQTKFSNLYLT